MLIPNSKTKDAFLDWLLELVGPATAVLNKIINFDVV